MTTKNIKPMNSVWAWVIDNDESGSEEIPSTILEGTSNMMIPLVAKDEETIQKLRPYAQSIANGNGRPLRLKRFVVAGTEETIWPEEV